jgi:hypothetical protein
LIRGSGKLQLRRPDAQKIFLPIPLQDLEFAELEGAD